jgi:phosphopantothenoylcysteine decarboxylase/phosphopantothenate--cysteine ligase
MSLKDRKIILGITGGIAAYKAAELTRLLVEEGAKVRVVMTKAAQAFITPLTLQALSSEPVRSELFDPAHEAAMGHIELARWADLILIAPATANCLAKLAHGRA